MTNHMINKFLTLTALYLLSSPICALTPTQIFAKVKNSVVVVMVMDAQGELASFGSGVYLPSGKVATNCHVVESADTVQINHNGQVHKATLYGGDVDRDLCLLSSPTLRATPVVLGNAATLNVGDPMFAVGSPKGLELTMSDGMVSGLRGTFPPTIQTTAAISKGSSGGGLFDSEGKLVGITTLYIDEGQNLNFAMPVEWLAQIKPISDSVPPPPDKTGNVDTGRYTGQWSEQADRLLDAEDWNGLYALAKRWQAAEPNSSEAWRIAGTALNDLEKPALAENEFAQAAKLNPANDLAWLGLGLSAMKQDHFQQALPAFIRYTQLKPEDALGFTLVGFLQSWQGEIPSAIASYKKSLNLDPNDSDTWEELGKAYLDIDMNEQAGNALQNAYRLNPKDVSIVSAYGEQALVVGDYQKALKLSHSALEIDPAYPTAWFVKGSANLFMNNISQATEDLLNAVSLDSEFVSAWYNLAIAHRQNYKYVEAMQAYRMVLKLDPKAAAELYPKIKP